MVGGQAMPTHYVGILGHAGLLPKFVEKRWIGGRRGKKGKEGKGIEGKGVPSILHTLKAIFSCYRHNKLYTKMFNISQGSSSSISS